MALISITNLTSGTGSSASSFNTSSITPSANKVILVVVQTMNTSSTPNTPSLSGCGITWTQVATANAGPGSSSNRCSITLFKGSNPSPTAGALTISYSGQSQANCGWSIDQVTGGDAGSDSANAIVQSNTNTQNDTNTGSHSGSFQVTLSAFSNPNNATYGALMNTAFVTYSFSAGFSQLSSVAFGQVIWANNNQTSNTWTWSSRDSNSAGVLIELKAISSFLGAMI